MDEIVRSGYHTQKKDIIAIVASFINNTTRKMILKFCNITIAQKLLSTRNACTEEEK